MTTQEHIRAGDLGGALDSVKQAIRKNPGDWKLRSSLFQILSVMGDWDGALTQLNVMADMSSDAMMLAYMYRPVVQCEALRAEVFAGSRSPLIFGEPQEWLGLLVHANGLAAGGRFAEAKQVLGRALEQAPATTGKINDHDFEWIADADTRMGPVIEAIVDGKYFWIPFNRISRIEIQAPADLGDLVWITAKFTWSNEGEGMGLIPVRYPGSEAATDGAIRLARRTEWREPAEGFYFGAGQRMFATDADEYPLLETRTVVLNPAEPSRPEPAEGGAAG